MRRSILLALAAALAAGVPSVQAQQGQQRPATAGFGTFEHETARITLATNCQRPRNTAAGLGMGALWGCIQGRAETAKVFVNEEAGRRGAVRDVKVMWNEYTRNIGEGLAADRTDAQRIVSAVADLYAPRLRQRLTDTFMGRNSTTITEGSFSFVYRYSPGPAAAEHLLTITQR